MNDNSAAIVDYNGFRRFFSISSLLSEVGNFSSSSSVIIIESD